MNKIVSEVLRDLASLHLRSGNAAKIRGAVISGAESTGVVSKKEAKEIRDGKASGKR